MILDPNTQSTNNAPKKTVNRANLVPVAEDKTYEISTIRAKEFLKAKLNAIPGQENTTMLLFTLRISERFQPFIVLLPKTVLSTGKKNKDEDDSWAARYYAPSDSEGRKKKLNIVKPVFDLLKTYAYSDIFGDIAEDKSIRSSLGLTRGGIADMQVVRKPHIESVSNKGKKVELVAMAVDPIILFSDMLAVNGAKDNSAYDIVVEGVTKVDDTNSIYRVRRAYKNRGDKGNLNNIGATIAKRYSSVGRD